MDVISPMRFLHFILVIQLEIQNNINEKYEEISQIANITDIISLYRYSFDNPFS